MFPEVISSFSGVYDRKGMRTMNDDIGFSAAPAAETPPDRPPHGGPVRPRRWHQDSHEDTTHKGLLTALGDTERAAALLSKVCFIARARYGILSQDAEDIFHESVATYLSIHKRYPPKDNRFGILVGIFHKKSLMFLRSRDWQGRVARRFVARLQADRPIIARGEDPSGCTLEKVLRSEDAQIIREAIAGLDESRRELLLALAEGRMTRKEMIKALGVNRNTFDTRLRAVRMQLKSVLAESGVA